jgi:hypothetical protein
VDKAGCLARKFVCFPLKNFVCLDSLLSCSNDGGREGGSDEVDDSAFDGSGQCGGDLSINLHFYLSMCLSVHLFICL